MQPSSKAQVEVMPRGLS